MRLAETRGALRRNLAGVQADWSDELLDGGIARAIDDLDRVIPLEKIEDFTLTFAITDEAWNSGTLGDTITLGNKRISAKSEVVKDTGGGITYVRDTDYTINYAAGTIVALASGSIPADTSVNITYRVMAVYIDISGLTDLIRISRMEYPAGNIPSQFNSFYTWGDFLVLTSRGRETQQNMAEKDHVWLYYHAKHTSPQVTVDGSWHPQLDEVVIKGAEGYSLLTKALEIRHSARIRLTSANTALGELAAISTKIATSLANTATQATSASSDLSNLDAKLDDMVAALAAASGFLASAGSSLALAETQAASADTDISSAVDSPLSSALTRLATVDGLITNTTTLINRARTVAEKADSPIVTARGAIAEALPLIRKSDDRLVQTEVRRAAALTIQFFGQARLPSASIAWLRMDQILNALNASILDPITPVSDNITAAGNSLISAVAATDKVNTGEIVSEMHGRHADRWRELGRLQYDAWLTHLGRVDRRIGQASSVIAEAAEYRLEAETHLAEANVTLGEINVLLGQISALHDSAGRGVEAGQAYVAEGQVIVGASNASVGAAGRGIEQANSYVASARVRLDAAAERGNLVNSYVAVASQHVNMAQAKIAEGNALATPVDAILGRVSRKIEIASIFQQESDRLLQELSLKQQESDRYIALAVGESDLADEFEEVGTRIKGEFMGILTDRAQVRADTALAPVRQESP